MLEARNRESVGGERFGVGLIEDLPTRLQQQLVELVGLKFMEEVVDGENILAYYEGESGILMLGYRGAELRYFSHVVVTVGGGFTYQHYSYYGNGWHVTGGVVEGSEDWRRIDDFGLGGGGGA